MRFIDGFLTLSWIFFPVFLSVLVEFYRIIFCVITRSFFTCFWIIFNVSFGDDHPLFRIIFCPFRCSFAMTFFTFRIKSILAAFMFPEINTRFGQPTITDLFGMNVIFFAGTLFRGWSNNDHALDSLHHKAIGSVSGAATRDRLLHYIIQPINCGNINLELSDPLTFNIRQLYSLA